MAKLFILSTRPESRWVDDHTKPGYTPVLNDKFPHGDIVHVDYDSAWRLAQDIAYSLPGAKGMVVWEIEVDDAVVNGLTASGDITDNPEKDAFGAQLRKLSVAACASLNQVAKITKHEFLIPEAHLAAMGNFDRLSTTLQ